MAAKYLRRQTWWVRFYYPLTGGLVRDRLETHDEAQAELLRLTIELLCRRIEVDRTLTVPRFRAAAVPSALRNLLFPEPARRLLDFALAKYLAFVRNDNASHHIAGKLSILRAFIGMDRVNRIADLPESDGKREARAGCFTGDFVDEITPELLQDFFDTLVLSQRTKRHYRELFHHFFSYCIKFRYYQPPNIHCPNPAAAMPGYSTKTARSFSSTTSRSSNSSRCWITSLLCELPLQS